MKHFLLPFITITLASALLLSCNQNNTTKTSTDNDSTNQLIKPNADTLLSADDRDSVLLLSDIQSGKPTLVASDVKQQQQLESIKFSGKGADERKRGIRLAATGHFEGAIKAFDKAIEENKENADGYFYRAKAKADAKDYKGAEKDYNQAIQIRANQAAFYYYKRQCLPI